MLKAIERGEMVQLDSKNSFKNLVNMVSRSNMRNAYHSIENNLLTAALHANAMNSLAFPTGCLPDFPQDILTVDYRYVRLI